LIKTGFFSASLVLILYSVIDNIFGFIHISPIIPSLFVLAGLGAANSFLDVPVNTMIQENTPEEVRSRVYGVISSVIGIASVVPIILSGSLADAVGVRYVMFLTGFTLLLLALLYNQSTKYASRSN
ncbi:MFS transporter, partial [Candidatus Microgenomates bacterium]|nr:MFS transporter [Candidatus Microgenomates bacterium]